MGSLTSRPDIPQVQQQPVIVTLPAPTVTNTPAPVTTSAPSVNQTAQTNVPSGQSPSTEAPAEGTTSEEAQRLVREDNLLRRSRGRLGTVLTGFKGVLSQTVGQAARKTLLGE